MGKFQLLHVFTNYGINDSGSVGTMWNLTLVHYMDQLIPAMSQVLLVDIGIVHSKQILQEYIISY